VRILEGPPHTIHSLVFAPDNGTLYAVHERVGVHAWNLAKGTGETLRVGEHPVFGAFALHPGGRWALGRLPGASTGNSDTDHDARLIRLAPWKASRINFLGVAGCDLAFSPNGKRLVTLGHSDYDRPRRGNGREYRIYGWKATATGARYAWHRDTPEADAKAWRVAFAGDDALLTEDRVATGPMQYGMYPTKPHLRLRSATDGSVSASAEIPAGLVDQLLASPDGTRAVVREGMRLWVYETADLSKPPVEIAGSDQTRVEPHAAAFDRSGRFLLLANNGPSVRVFDTATWREVRKWKWSAGTLRAIAVSPDGTLAAAGSARGTVVVWDFEA
jgi:WD40 repeat protein